MDWGLAGGKGQRENQGDVLLRPTDGSTGALSVKLSQANMAYNLKISFSFHASYMTSYSMKTGFNNIWNS